MVTRSMNDAETRHKSSVLRRGWLIAEQEESKDEESQGASERVLGGHIEPSVYGRN